MPEPETDARRFPSLRLLVVLALMCVALLVGTAAWGTYRVVSWARDLPNRIDIQINEDTLGQAAGEAVLMTLRDGDPGQRKIMLDQLGTGDLDNADYRHWIQSVLRPRIDALCNDSDNQVATSARSLVEKLDNADLKR